MLFVPVRVTHVCTSMRLSEKPLILRSAAASTPQSHIRSLKHPHSLLSVCSIVDLTNVVPLQGLCFLPKTSCDVRDVEVARAVRLSKTTIEPVSFKVPRVRVSERASEHSQSLFKYNSAI